MGCLFHSCLQRPSAEPPYEVHSMMSPRTITHSPPSIVLCRKCHGADQLQDSYGSYNQHRTQAEASD
ncbi:hypothetical protein Y1Q_0015626 [Alligator mississippiensis]|uniref:Uncharacterized protein n=1 Tax=Alligator mississippiensis TaxID=8496 RepID=A0A151NNL7_ALLMI|nr:hypothetical protein Y1Q_0015626 [Alligator mississippiensis]